MSQLKEKTKKIKRQQNKDTTNKKRRSYQEDDDRLVKKGVNKFFELYAQEGNESEDEDVGRGTKRNANMHLDAYYEEGQLKKRAPDFKKKVLDIENRIIEQQDNEYGESGNSENQSMSDGLASQENERDDISDYAQISRDKLPSVNDPKIWQVRVKKGYERVAAMSLMNKMIDYAQTGKPFSILSASYIEKIENLVFVEAYKIESVRQAIQGLNFCYQKIDMLPLEEMTKIYEDSQSNLVMPKVNQWVRIKGGQYQGDLGLIDSVQNDDKIYVKLIPRYDPNSLKPNREKVRQTSFLRYPQNPFDEQYLKDINPMLYGQGKKTKADGFSKHFFQFKNNLYRKGFVYKSFSLKQIDSVNIRPTNDERDQFYQTYNDNMNLDEDSSDMDAETTKNFLKDNPESALRIGDKIIVKSGDLQQTVGVIIKFENMGETLVFKPTNLEGFEDNLCVSRQLCAKFVKKDKN